jgi:hypothetical protein
MAMQISLYIDEDAMSRALVQGLRARNVDVMTVLDCGMEGKSDPEQLAFAASLGRAIYTYNVGDFCQLHTEFLAQGKEHTGIIVVNRQRYSIGEQLKQTLQLIHQTTAEEMRNALHFL